jgi:hypothetical protein
MVANQLPEAVRNILPHAELDLAATVAANLAGNINSFTSNAANGFAGGDGSMRSHVSSAQEGVHEGVTCDKSGVNPIVGNRYHLVGHNYDLCEAEFEKLPEKEKALFKKIPPPGAVDNSATVGFHPGVQCDRSGMTPIIGIRYKLRGHNYDLCEAEFEKLDDSEKAQYAAIPPPVIQSSATAEMINSCNGGPWRGHFRGGWGRGWGGAFGKGMGGGKGKGCGKGGGADGVKLSARFISDVTIFDGTQVAPGTKFTKIWKIKNCGEVPWPLGTRMLFVGGDQMTAEMVCKLCKPALAPQHTLFTLTLALTLACTHGGG